MGEVLDLFRDVVQEFCALCQLSIKTGVERATKMNLKSFKTVTRAMTVLMLMAWLVYLLPGAVFPVYAAAGDITRVSVSSSGVQGNGYSRSADISADGRFVAFRSEASNLVAGD